MKDVPIFDHSKNTGSVHGPKGRFLIQDGNTFSYAEYDKNEKRYVPEPRYIPPDKKSETELKDMMEELMYLIIKLEKVLIRFQDTYNKNLDSFYGDQGKVKEVGEQK
jgi:hypothetical protein